MPLDLDATARFFNTLHIRDRDIGTRKQFRLRPQQVEIMERCKDHLAKKRRLYVIFLKARRVGISTWASAIQTAHCLSKSDGHAAIIAQIRETSSELFQQAAGFAKDLRPVIPEIGIGAKQITYPHQRAESSNLRHYTAATVHGTRGLTFSSVHMTEAAFYPYEGAYTAILNTLSKDPDNICLIETTANGMEGPGEAYYEYWQAAEGGDNEFLPIFLPWYEDPEYVMDPESAEDAPRDDYERYLMTDLKDHRTGKSIKLGKDRIAWFRDTLYSKCEGSLDKWKAEYPSSPMEAFIATGSPAFTHEELQFAHSSQEPPLHRGYIVPNDLGKMRFEEERSASGDDLLLIWEYPQQHAHYFAGVDTARGEETNITPGDYAAVVVWNAETGNMAARFMGRVSPEKIAKMASDIGRFYNDAALNVELNNLGYVVMRELRDRLYYPNQYRWKGRDDKFDGKPGTAFGFETTDRYRRMMFNLFRTALYRKEAVPKDAEFVRQMTATKMEMGFRWNIAVGHDDVMMAALLGWIAKEQFHPQVCNPRKPKNLILTPEQLEAELKQQTGQASPEVSWLIDGTSTALGSLMVNANDHLREIAKYEKRHGKVDRLAGI
jgi:hypothetical protein